MPEVTGHKIWALGWGESRGWFDFSPKNSAWDMMGEEVCGPDEAANHQLPTAAVFWIIPVVSTEKCSSLPQNWTQIHYSAHSVILNVTATQYTCSLNGIYCPHWLEQRSHHCSPIHIPVHSLWLPGNIDIVQTTLIILKMAGLFLDSPRCIFF